jgi:CDP-diacylglycerol--glycerol-3-phosphate 3-phosphatidyltransferase
VLNERLRPVIEPLTSGAGRALARAHLTPNALTTIGLAGTLACAWLIVDGRTRAAGALLIPFVIVDVLDGATARAMNRVTAWGGFYDSVCDRVGDGALLGAIAWAARVGAPRLCAASLVALVATMCVPYARAKAEAMNVSAGSGPGERAERAIILIAGLILLRVEIAVWTVAALTIYTFVARCVAVWRQTTATDGRG